MKTLKGLDEKLSTIEEIPAGVDAKLPTYRLMYKAAVGGSLAKSGDEAVEHYQLGLKLRIEGNEIDLEDAEFKLLKAAVEKNPSQWNAHFHAQVVLKIKDSEKSAPKLKEA